VNCAAIPHELYESEFFGHARGAFSGAVRQRVGRFEAAEGGTLFLDEVGEIPLDLQGKLLRVLQESTFERVGETHSRRASVRIVAATNRDLLGAIADGQFRADLYYRLNVFPIETPPLRERREDIAPIAVHLVQAMCRRMHRPPPALDRAALAMLEAYDWPGNVRELQNVLERAVITTPRGAEHLRVPALGPRPHTPRSPLVERAGASGAPAILTDEELKRLEHDNLVAALRATAGRIAGPGGAAALLGIKPSTLTSRLRKLGIDPSGARQPGSAKQAG
jgi:transcriptional regulator with GAF, ATPase, and Fis domain